MLCFLFSALIVALDQFFKHWIMRTLDIGDKGPEIIPGVLGLTRWENDGAMLNILSGQQWLLAGIAFGAAVVLIMILLRYNEGFWGTLGLAAVLGGTIGNLADRIFNEGKVVDMFRTLFIEFPIFNIADIFITLGFITFLIHFIVITVKSGKKERSANDYDEDDYDEEYDDDEYNNDSSYNEFPEIDTTVAKQAEKDISDPYKIQAQYTPQDSYSQYEPQDDYSQYDAPQTQNVQQSQLAQDDYSSTLSDFDLSSDFGSITDTTSDTSFTLDALEAELGSMDDYSVDDLLREYGLDDDDTL